MYQIDRPPEILLEPCDDPDSVSLETNRDLVIYLLEFKKGYDLCAARITALRAYFGLE